MRSRGSPTSRWWRSCPKSRARWRRGPTAACAWKSPCRKATSGCTAASAASSSAQDPRELHVLDEHLGRAVDHLPVARGELRVRAVALDEAAQGLEDRLQILLVGRVRLLVLAPLVELRHQRRERADPLELRMLEDE